MKAARRLISGIGEFVKEWNRLFDCSLGVASSLPGVAAIGGADPWVVKLGAGACRCMRVDASGPV